MTSRHENEKGEKRGEDPTLMRLVSGRVHGRVLTCLMNSRRASTSSAVPLPPDGWWGSAGTGKVSLLQREGDEMAMTS